MWLFLILHHVLCVLAIDPGTNTECTETPICEEPCRSRWYQSPCYLYRDPRKWIGKDIGTKVFYHSLITYSLH